MYGAGLFSGSGADEKYSASFGSLIFYGWGEPKYLPVMAAVILAGYLSARLIGTCQNKRQSKILLAAAVLLEIFPLIYCKYADFFIQNLNVLTGQKIPLLSIAMPLGISFYTFQVISYTVDVYRGDVPAQKNLLTFAAYVAMFPQLVAGPIVRYSDIRSQLENRMHSVEKCAYGIQRFVTGLSKKILIANVLGALIGQFQASEEKSVLFFWMYAVAFMLQIYFDFSGYSDMAVGLGAVFGFDFRKTSAILIVLRALPNSGADGIFHLAHGSGIIFTSRWAAVM